MEGRALGDEGRDREEQREPNRLNLKDGQKNELKSDGTVILTKESVGEIYKAYTKIWDRAIPNDTMECMERTIMTKKGCLTKSDKCPRMDECRRFQIIMKECIPAAISIIEEKRMKALVEKIVEYLDDKI